MHAFPTPHTLISLCEFYYSSSVNITDHVPVHDQKNREKIIFVSFQSKCTDELVGRYNF